MKWKDITAIAGLQYSGMTLNFFLQLFLTFLLAPEVFGVYAKLAAVREIYGAVLSANLAMSVIYIKEENQQKLLSTSFYLALLQAAVYIAGAVIFYPLAGKIAGFNESEAKIFLILVAGLVFTSIQQVLFSFFEKEERFKFNSAVTISIQFITAGAVIVVSLLTKDLTALILRDVFPALILFIIYIALALRKWGSEFVKPSAYDKILAKKMILYSFKMYFSRTIESIFFRLDILFAAAYFNTGLVGIYERIKYFASLPQTLITSIIGRINLVKYAKNDNIVNVQRTNFVAIIINVVLFPVIYFVLYFLDEAFAKGIRNYLFPMYIFFFAYAGFGSIIENIKTYFYATNNVLRSAILLRLIPVIIFLLIWIILPQMMALNIAYNALLFSTAMIIPIVFVQSDLYKFRINIELKK